MDNEKAQKIIEDIFTLLAIPTEAVTYALNEKRGHVFSIKSAEFERLTTERPDVTKDLIYLLRGFLIKVHYPGKNFLNVLLILMTYKVRLMRTLK